MDSWQALCTPNNTTPSPDERCWISVQDGALLWLCIHSPRAEAGLGCFFLSSFTLFHITPGFEVQRKATLNVPFFFFFKATFIMANLFLRRCVAGDRYQAKRKSPLLTMDFPSLLNFK